MKKFLVLTSLAAALLSACGGGGSGSVSVNPQPAAVSNTAVQINLGDAPADRLLAVGMTVNTLTLHHADGRTVSVLGTPQPIEMMHLMGTVTPLALSGIPQGAYTGATMSFGPAAVTHVDTATGQLVQRTVPGPMTASMRFDPPLAVGAAPMVFNFDMNMAASIAIDASGNVAMTPVLTARSNPVVAGSRHPEDGGMHGVTGMVGGVQGGGFTLSTAPGLSGVPMSTHAATHYSGLGDTHVMSGNMLVSVDAMPQADGTWRVDHVQSRMGAGGSMAGGIVSAIGGSPPTQLTIVMHYGIGGGVLPSDLAGTTTVSLGDGTQFAMDADDVDLAGLPFTPLFDRNHLGKGQALRAWSSQQVGHGHGMGAMPGGGTVAASAIELEQQGLRGTVASYASSGSQASFTLTLAADSAFARLTGATAVTVHQQGGTQLRGVASMTNGSTVQVRGLLFVDGAAYRLVASRIVAG